jgi:hypothetical protein
MLFIIIYPSISLHYLLFLLFPDLASFAYAK